MKVLIGIPIREIYGEPKPKTHKCIELLRAHTPHATEVSLTRGQQITQNSFSIVRKALNEGWDYLLYTGDDITFPPTALDQLMARDKDIVGSVCTWKTPPYWVPAGMEVKGQYRHVLISPEDIQERRLKKLDFVGSGFMLIKRKALQAIEELLRDKVYREIPEEYRWMCPPPYFPVTFDPDRNVITGADFSFCRLARKAGMEIYLDCGVVCGHRWEGEYDIRDHWDWLDKYGVARTEPRWPFDPIQREPVTSEYVYMGPEQEPIPVTVTSAGNEYHALEHIQPILKSFYVRIGDTEQYGRTPGGYIVGFHVHKQTGYDDYMKFAAKFDKVLIHWVGSDILGIPKWMNAQREAELNAPKFIHLVEEERLKPELDPYFKNIQVVSIPTLKVPDLDPMPDNFTVAVYYPKHRHHFHYGDVLRGVIEALPDVKFKLYHLFGDKPDFEYPNMAWLGYLPGNEYLVQIARSSCLLRLSKHDGRSFSIVEFAMAGRHVIANFDMPFVERVPDVPTVESVVEAIKKLRAQDAHNLESADYYRRENNHVRYRETIKRFIGSSYEYERYWESRYASGARGAGGPVPLGKEASWVNERIVDVVKEVGADTVLDVGCGSMVRWDKLPVKPDNYTGVDVSAKAVDMAHERYPEATFFVADLAEDSVPEADVVTAIDFFPHVKPEHFPMVMKKVFGAARKAVIVKTSLGVDDGFYQYSHNWNGSVPGGWKVEDKGNPPDNTVARFFVFRKQEKDKEVVVA